MLVGRWKGQSRGRGRKNSGRSKRDGVGWMGRVVWVDDDDEEGENEEEKIATPSKESKPQLLSPTSSPKHPWLFLQYY